MKLKQYILLSICTAFPTLGSSQDVERDLAKELANPIASLYTLPLQMNYDRGIGPTGDGSIYQLNAQPLIPFSLNEDWHLISRTIIPFIHQEDVSNSFQAHFPHNGSGNATNRSGRDMIPSVNLLRSRAMYSIPTTLESPPPSGKSMVQFPTPGPT